MASESANTQQYSVDNSDNDGSTFKLPGDNPGEEPFSLEGNFDQYYRWYIHVDNGWNQDVDVTAEGSHSLDSAGSDKLDSPVDDGGTITVSSTSADFIDGTTNHSQIQLNVAPAADPTSGVLTVTIEKRKS